MGIEADTKMPIAAILGGYEFGNSANGPHDAHQF